MPAVYFIAIPPYAEVPFQFSFCMKSGKTGFLNFEREAALPYAGVGNYGNAGVRIR